MCLLEEVLSWDPQQARCTTTAHRSAHNPLRSNGRLGAVCGIEFAAQAMAVHGALVAAASGVSTPPGFLASVRAVELHVDRLDDVPGDLDIKVARTAGDDRTAMYEFSVTSGERILLQGRTAIAFNLIPVGPP
jgi:predicted hotdog family 3-hydroxylacyl-ACP dehydratase